MWEPAEGGDGLDGEQAGVRRGNLSLMRVSSAAVVVAAWLGSTACSDLVFHERPGDAAIVVKFRYPTQDPELDRFCKRYRDAPGVTQTDCGINGATFAFRHGASGRELGHLSLALHRDALVASVLVSVVGPSGYDVERP